MCVRARARACVCAYVYVCDKVLARTAESRRPIQSSVDPQLLSPDHRTSTHSAQRGVALRHELKEALAGSDVDVLETFLQVKGEGEKISREIFREAMGRLSADPVRPSLNTPLYLTTQTAVILYSSETHSSGRRNSRPVERR